MADRFLEDFAADLPAGSWDEQLAAAAWRLRQVLLSHRDGARVMAGTYVAEPNTILLSNLVIEILQAAGLPPDRAAGPPLPRSTTCSATPLKNKPRSS